MEKYGFVYVWYDRKHKRYYVGCHWGDEEDGYICSSRWMRKSYRRRPQDFKRRTVAKVYTNRKDLLKEEHRWLSMIKNEELKIRYYNFQKNHFGHWTANPDSRYVKQKISDSLLNMDEEKKSEMTRKQSEAKKGKRLSSKTEFKKGQVPWNKGLKGAQVAWNKGITGEQNHNFGKPRSEEVKKKISESQKGVSRKSGMQGKKHSEETKLKISQSKRRAV